VAIIDLARDFELNRGAKTIALWGTMRRSEVPSFAPLGSTVAPGTCLNITLRVLVAFSTATNFKRRRVVTGGSPLRILATVPLNP
jgi:hypothetical protein